MGTTAGRPTAAGSPPRGDSDPAGDSAAMGLALAHRMIGDELKNQQKRAEAVEAYREAVRARGLKP